MVSKSTSLLTKTQRHRLNNDFEDLDEEAKRRDQQLIRERVRSGVLDFRELADYPDRQYELAFEEVSERELRAALADMYLAAERIRDLHHYDRDQLVTEARKRAEDVSARADGVRSLERLDLHTEAEVRQQTEDRLAPNRWESRAMGLVKLTGWTGFISALLLLHTATLATIGVIEEAAIIGFMIVALVCGVGGAVIIAGHTLLYDIPPALRTLSRHLQKVGRTARHRWG